MFDLASQVASPTLTIPMLLERIEVPECRQLHVQAGEFIIAPNETQGQRYLLVSGEVVVLRDGQPIDFIEPGELIDPAIWPGAVAVAWYAAVLQPLN